MMLPAHVALGQRGVPWKPFISGRHFCARVIVTAAEVAAASHPDYVFGQHVIDSYRHIEADMRRSVENARKG